MDIFTSTSTTTVMEAQSNGTGNLLNVPEWILFDARKQVRRDSIYVARQHNLQKNKHRECRKNSFLKEARKREHAEFAKGYNGTIVFQNELQMPRQVNETVLKRDKKAARRSLCTVSGKGNIHKKAWKLPTNMMERFADWPLLEEVVCVE